MEPVQNQIQSLKSDIKQLQTDAVKPLPQSLAEAAVHTENFITSVPWSPALQFSAIFCYRILVFFVFLWKYFWFLVLSDKLGFDKLQHHCALSIISKPSHYPLLCIFPSSGP